MPDPRVLSTFFARIVRDELEDQQTLDIVETNAVSGFGAKVGMKRPLQRRRLSGDN
jgi:hypothetical protein